MLHQHSTISDWLFPVFLLLLAVSGMMIHTFRYLDMPLSTYNAYVTHLVVMMGLYLTVGPLGKWDHLLCRPFAIYFQTVKEKAKAQKLVASAQAN